MSPTARTLKKLREDGFQLVQVVETFNHWSKLRHDLFGIIDVLAVGNGETLAVQATSGSHVSDRVQKLAESDAIGHLRDAGWRVECWGWRKVKVKRGGKAVRWEVRVVDVS